jgi:hypothetical protein
MEEICGQEITLMERELHFLLACHPMKGDL